MTAWSRNIGIAIPDATASIRVNSDSWMRPLNIQVDVVKLRCVANDTTTGDPDWVKRLPEIPSHAPSVPDPIRVDPQEPPPPLTSPDSPDHKGAIPHVLGNRPFAPQGPREPSLASILSRCQSLVAVWPQKTSAKSLFSLKDGEKTVLKALLEIPRPSAIIDVGSQALDDVLGKADLLHDAHDDE